jgi:hypothetical protein
LIFSFAPNASVESLQLLPVIRIPVDADNGVVATMKHAQH